MIRKSSADREEIDRECSELSRKALTGELPEAVVRNRIAELIRQLDLGTTATHAYNQRTNRMLGRGAFQDMCGRAEAFLYERIRPDNQHSSHLDLDKLAQGASVIGWGRQLLTSALPTLARPEWRLRAEISTDLSNAEEEERSIAGRSAGNGGARTARMTSTYLVSRSKDVWSDPADRMPEEDGEQLVEALRLFQDSSDYLEGSKLHLAKSQALMLGYLLPKPIRVHPDQRPSVLAEFLADPESNTGDIIEQLLAQLDSSVEPPPHSPPTGMLIPFSGYAAHHLEILREHPDVAQQLLFSSLSEYPFPSRTIVSYFRRRTRTLATKPGQASAMKAITDAYLILECEAISHRDHSGADSQDARRQAHEQARTEALEKITRTQDSARTPLPYTHEQMLAALDSLLFESFFDEIFGRALLDIPKPPTVARSAA